MAPGSSVKRFLRAWREAILVVGAAVVGVVASAPVKELVDRGAINVVLFVLVFAAAMTVPFDRVAAVRDRASRVLVVLVASAVVLPAVAWFAAHLVPEGPARLGVMAIGVAPAEIATVALTAVARGATATAAVLLVATTALTAVLAAPVLSLLAGAGTVRVGELIVTILAVVVLPFILGVAVRHRSPDAVEAPAGHAATGTVVLLVGLVASQVTVDAALGPVVLALVVIVGLGAAIGIGLGGAVEPADRSAVLLSTSMRDFAVASGIAAAAFGPEAAAPLGIYGVLVMVWGSIVAGAERRRASANDDYASSR